MMYATSRQRFRAVCPDGRVRVARPTAEPDTVFTIPARVSAHGRTVSGFVAAADPVLAELYAETMPAEHAAALTGAPYVFYPARAGKNADVLGAWPESDKAAQTAHILAGMGLEHADNARSAACMPGERCAAPCAACGTVAP
jgi:hypothetical protein